MAPQLQVLAGSTRADLKVVAVNKDQTDPLPISTSAFEGPCLHCDARCEVSKAAFSRSCHHQASSVVAREAPSSTTNRSGNRIKDFAGPDGEASPQSGYFDKHSDMTYSILLAGQPPLVSFA